MLGSVYNVVQSYVSMTLWLCIKSFRFTLKDIRLPLNKPHSMESPEPSRKSLQNQMTRRHRRVLRTDRALRYFMSHMFSTDHTIIRHNHLYILSKVALTELPGIERCPSEPEELLIVFFDLLNSVSSTLKIALPPRPRPAVVKLNDSRNVGKQRREESFSTVTQEYLCRNVLFYKKQRIKTSGEWELFTLPPVFS